MTTLQHSNERAWQKTRAQGIGASEIAAALGCSRYQTPRQLWSAKVGLPTEERKVHDRMRWGTVMEPVAAAWLSHTWGVDVRRPSQYAVEVHPQHSWMRATLDARVHVDLTATCDAPRGEYVCDFKLISPWDREWRDGSAPDDYVAQIGQQMLVAGVPRGLLVALPFGQRVDMPHIDWDELSVHVGTLAAKFPPEYVLGLLGCEQPIVRIFEADPALDATIIQRGSRFWANVVAAREVIARHGGELSDACWEELRPYEPDAQPGDMGDMRTQYVARERGVEAEPEMVASLRAAAENAKTAEHAYDALRAQAMQLMGTATTLTCDGKTVATFHATTRGRQFRLTGK